MRYLCIALTALVVLVVGSQTTSLSAANGIFISEVHPTGSGNATYSADWFEITNSGAGAVTVTGWKVDDSSNAAASAVALRGVTSIPAGTSAVFVEGGATDVNDATLIAAFSTAWFGTSAPPAGVVIGVYGGAGIGLGNGGDAVNLFDAAGNRLSGVAFGAATAAVTFDNAAGIDGTTLPLPLIAALSTPGLNGASRSFNSLEIGSPGRITTPALDFVDLSTYVRIGRFDLPEPTRTPPPANSVLAQEVSAVTYNWDTDSLFVVGDGGTAVVQVSKTGQLIDSMTLAQGGSAQGTEFFDPEGLTYIGDGQFVMVEERDRRVVRFTYAAGTTLTRDLAKTVQIGNFVGNIGIEGLTWDPATSGFIAVKETQPQGIFQTAIDFDAGTATNGAPTADNSVNLFDPTLLTLLDLADVFALSNLPGLQLSSQSANLLVLSQESGRIVNVDRSGTVWSSLAIVSDLGNPLSVANQQHEGLTMDRNGYLYVVSENGGGDFDHPQLWVYAPSLVPNLVPTDITLTNQVSQLAENIDASARVKVADVVVTDDGLGTNNLSVSGPDAATFDVDASGLYIKAGTTLDFETKSSYSVTVAVDDPTLGSSPDATAVFSLSLIDVVIETPPQPALIVSEAAPWSSGNSVAALRVDWFEVTNTGAAAVDITGWKVDDSSSAFASALTLNGIASIAPGESVIFMETNDLATKAAAFRALWFGASPPAGLRIGSYSGSGIGLSTDGDAVNLFDATGTLRASVSFGPSSTGPVFATFNNAAGLNNSPITQLSIPGVNGAIMAAGDGNEIGSPGSVGRIFISEVAPWSSGNSPVGADWFEVTNSRAHAVDITGWKVDDSSGSPVAAVSLNGVSSIAPGQSVIFIETNDLTTKSGLFLSNWFDGFPPAALQIGSYTGAGLGLSTDGDGVNLYNSAGVLQASVTFGASPTNAPFVSFDNSTALNNSPIPHSSAVGVNGAFVALSGASEIGSPGTVAIAVNDDDGDGFTNAQELASAGVPSGNLVGSHPLRTASTPEVCNGLDDDLNEGIDEGFPDADVDQTPDCVDFDDDGDGIVDAIDPSPVAPSNAFSDGVAPLAGTTSGTLTRNGTLVVITDAEPNPAVGVQVVVSGTASGSAEIRLDGKADIISLPNGVYVITDPASTSTVTVLSGGPARITAALNGLPVVIVVGEGATVTYTQISDAGGALIGLTVDAVVGSVMLNGRPVTAAFTLVGPPTSSDACTGGGWQAFNFPGTFKNQGDCVSYVATGGRNAPAGR